MKTEHDVSSPDWASDGTRMESSLMQKLERAREQRGSPSLWDAVAARLDSEERQREFVAPMLQVLDQIRERVDDETWRLLLDFEWRSYQEVMAAVEVGLELGYNHGRAAAIVTTSRIPGNAASVFAERLADFLGDTDADPLDALLTVLTSLRANVMAIP